MKNNKKSLITLTGKVIELLPNVTFKIELENGSIIIAYASGKIRKNRIRILLGDIVSIEMTPYDSLRGRIVYRF